MDFVDLDKVLDEFEEEEKAADSLTPGQEVRPSGYSEYVEACRDKPWEMVSEVPPSGVGTQLGYGVIGKPNFGGQMYDYDIPYDSGGVEHSKPGYIDSGQLPDLQKKSGIEFGKGDLNLSLDNTVYPSSTFDSIQQQKNNLYETEEYISKSDLYIDSQPVVMSTTGEALKEHLNNSDLDFSSSNIRRQNGVFLEDYKSVEKGLRASKVTAVQTDALTPRIEKELSSAPFPKSDIIVDGHDASHTDIIVGGTFVANKSRDMNPGNPSLTSGVVNDDQTKLSAVEHQSLESCNSVSNVPVYDSKRDLDGGSEVNGFDPDGQPKPGAVVGFGNITEDIDEDEVEKYLQDSSNDTTVYNQSKSMSQDSKPKPSFTNQGLSNPDIVLDVGRSENLRLEQRTDVQYVQPTESNDKMQAVIQCNTATSVSVDRKPDINEPQNENAFLSNSGELRSADTSNFAPLPSLQDVKNSQGSFPDKEVSSSESSLTDATRESSSVAPSESSSSPSDQGSPQMLGIGARPKEPSTGKKNRPNSLLGLSKVSMETPCNIVHEVVEKTDMDASDGSVNPELQTVIANQDMDTQMSAACPSNSIESGISDASLGLQGMSAAAVSDVSSAVPQMSNTADSQETSSLTNSSQVSNVGNVPQMTSGGISQIPSMMDTSQMPTAEHKLMTNLEIRQQIEQEQKQRMDRASGQAGAPSDIPPDGQQDSQPGSLDGGEEEGEEAPVMRRSEELSGIDGQTARPHSWSPSSGQTAPPGKLKRPTSLNLPPRGEFGVAGDRSPDMGGRMRRMKPDDIPEESDPSVGEEYSEGDGSLMEATGVTDDDISVPPSSDAPPQSIIHSHLGRVAPTWVPDNEAPNCMQCQARFTFTKRRHHCRACGKVFCSACCNQKTPLAYMDMKEARVCLQCYQILQSGSQRRTEPKQVMFSDGIRPGGDLTELDGSNETRLPPRRIGRVQKKVEKGGQSSPKTRKLRATENSRNRCLIPEDGLPPLYTTTERGDVSLEVSYDPDTHFSQMKDDEAEPVIFAINSNLQILVKILQLDCCVNRECWSFTTRGMCTVGQEEIVIIVECFPDETSPPRDMFCHFATVYEEAGKGNTVSDMGHTIFNQSFLDSRDHGGFLYLRATFQCLQKLLLPSPPYLFGILLQKWETPWAKVFPLRLLLRLGAEYRYYPCPLVSIRNRKPVFFEIGHTIMNLLADFRNYQYMLSQIRGVHIHMEDKKTIISFPRNRYDELMKMVNSSNEHVMALGSTFSPDADSHLVCIQTDEGTYQTQAINIQNKPRKVTGASFVVFNGALKTSSGLRAKSSIVEDGLMVQILPESMVAVKQAIKDMTDYTIGCGSVTIEKPEEVVILQWVDDDRNVNIGVKSPIDNMVLDGVESIHIHNSTDYMGDNRAIRWTEVFFIQNEDSGARWEPVDLSRLAETLASATCIALSQHLDRLKEGGLTKIGLRVTIDTEQVGYEIGANNEKLADFYMNDLDSGLIPVIHGAASQSQDGPIVLELTFHILE